MINQSTYDTKFDIFINSQARTLGGTSLSDVGGSFEQISCSKESLVLCIRGFRAFSRGN